MPKYLVLALGLATGAHEALAGDCFGRNRLDAKINAGPTHPYFQFTGYLDSMKVLIDGRIEGTISDLNCTAGTDGTKRVYLVATAHIGYTCNGNAVGTDSSGYTVTLECKGSNTSENKLSSQSR